MQQRAFKENELHQNNSRVMPNLFCSSVFKHWRGQYNLLLTTSVFLIGLRVCIGYIQSRLQTQIEGMLLAVWLAISLGILAWQLVGGWRACDNHIRDGGGMIAGWLGYGSLLVTLILTLLQFIDGVAGQIMLQPAPTPEKIELATSANGSNLLIDGPIDWETFNALKATLQQHGTIATVVLNSSGGRVFTARAMALIIEEHQLDTHVDHVCYSACTLVFLAGRKRTVSPNGELGFHQYSLQGINQLQNINISEELEKDRRFFLKRGLSATFVDSIFQADPQNLWKPDRQRLIDAGVINWQE